MRCQDRFRPAAGRGGGGGYRNVSSNERSRCCQTASVRRKTQHYQLNPSASSSTLNFAELWLSPLLPCATHYTVASQAAHRLATCGPQYRTLRFILFAGKEGDIWYAAEATVQWIQQLLERRHRRVSHGEQEAPVMTGSQPSWRPELS